MAPQQRLPPAAGGLVKVPYFVRAEDIDRGARLVFTPRDPAQLEALRRGIRQHASLRQSGGCLPPIISRRPAVGADPAAPGA
jgi:hypothetical protein